MIMASMVMARVIIVVIMIIVIVMIVVVVIVVVMIIVIAMIIVVVMVVDMDLAVEVLRFSPNQRWSNRSFNRQAATRTQPPHKDSTEQAIKRVMLGFVVEILLKSTMPFEGDDRGELKLSRLRYIPTATMRAMREGWPSLNQRQKK